MLELVEVLEYLYLILELRRRYGQTLKKLRGSLRASQQRKWTRRQVYKQGEAKLNCEVCLELGKDQ